MSDNAISGMNAATTELRQLAELMSTMVGAMEAFVDELDYVTPALTQNAEGRLRKVALHTALISSALTTAGVVILPHLLRALGIGH